MYRWSVPSPFGAAEAIRERPLSGCRVVITRPQGQAEPWIQALESLGCRVHAFPLIRIDPPEDMTPLDEALGHLLSFDWVVVTSPNGARVLGERYRHVFLPTRQTGVREGGAAGPDAQWETGWPSVCAVGPATAAMLRRYGIPVHLQPPVALGAAIPPALAKWAETIGRPQGLGGLRFLLIQSDLSDPTLAAQLAQLGAKVVAVTGYRTVVDQPQAQKAWQLLTSGGADLILFASPSAVNALVHVAQVRTNKAPLQAMGAVCIGPVTHQAFMKANAHFGLPETRIIAADEPTLAGVTAAVGRAWETVRTTRNG